MHIYTHTCTHTRAHTHTHTYTHTHAHTRAHTGAHTRAHTGAHTRAHTHTHTHTHIYTRAHTHTHTHSHIHTCTHTHTHTALSNTIGRIKTAQYHPTPARISWGALLEDVVTGYIVQIVGPGSTQEIPVEDKHSTSVEVSNLSASTEYTFQVSAVKGMDKSSLFTLPYQII